MSDDTTRIANLKRLIREKVEDIRADERELADLENELYDLETDAGLEHSEEAVGDV